MAKKEIEPQISSTLDVFADYYQFYLRDEQTEEDTPENWGEQLTTDRIAIGPGIIGVSTVRNTRVPVHIDLFSHQPNTKFDVWDHIAEASVEVPSGRIVIAGSSDYFPTAQRLSVRPGSYRVRVQYSGLRTVSENGLEGEDQYYVLIWPDQYRTPHIMKRWESI